MPSHAASLSAIALCALVIACAARSSDDRPPAAWPGATAPAVEILRCVTWHESPELGVNERDAEAELMDQLARRPGEFAAAVAEAAPSGHTVFAALREMSKSKADEIRALEVIDAIDRWTRVSSELAALMPIEDASVALMNVHRRCAIMEWYLYRAYDVQVRASVSAGAGANDAAEEFKDYHDLARWCGEQCESAQKEADLLGATIDPVTSRWPSRIDLAKRNAAIRKYGSLGRRDGPVGITIDDFFNGNCSHESIAVNLWVDHPGIETIRRALEDARSKPGVLDVRITVHEWPNSRNPKDDDLWIAADSVYLWTRGVGQDEMNAWLAPLRADWVSPVPDDFPVPTNDTPTGEGIVIYTVGWD